MSRLVGVNQCRCCRRYVQMVRGEAYCDRCKVCAAILAALAMALLLALIR